MRSVFKNSVILSILVLLFSCKNQSFNQQNTTVPYVIVNTFVSASNLSAPGTFSVINNQGSQGIIVYNLDGTYYRAFDLACPYLIPSKCKYPMTVDDSGVMTADKCSKDDISFSQYKTSVTINNNTYYLREYKVTLEGDSLNGTVRITNF